ncbi:MAG: glycosyltransferase [Candidatus Omnitrophota bacterium]|jgi:processive 1,2-diacylglycerol beta-glucosyltransferase
MKNIIIFYISEFGGHSKAAKNIREALLYKDPSLNVSNINGFGYFYPRTEKIVDFLYTKLISYLPFLWGKVYDRKKIIRRLNPCRRFVSHHTFKSLGKFIKKNSPDCFVATQAFPCGLIADFKENFNSKIPLIAVVTDYHPHGFWIHHLVDKYVVASQEAKSVLQESGIPEDKIEILGIPISIKFLKSYQKSDSINEFGFRKDLKTILLMGGGLGLGPIEKIAQSLDGLDSDFQIIVVCGKNEKLYNWFNNNKAGFKKPLFCFNYVEFVDKLMDCADVIITKGGGITISEALAKGLAAIITNPIPGQEERNVIYLLKKGAILRADDPSAICASVSMLFGNKENLDSLRGKAKSIAAANSSLDIAELIIKAVN